MKLHKNFVAHETVKKRTSQGSRKRVKFSSMNKHRKRSFKAYNSQGR